MPKTIKCDITLILNDFLAEEKHAFLKLIVPHPYNFLILGRYAALKA